MFVYVVTSYTTLHQTERLLQRLRRDSPDARLIVSHDRKMPPPDAAALDAVGAELWLTSEPITWGDASYLESLLTAILRADLNPEDWITILTGQDYPVRPLRDYERHLEMCGADMLLEEPPDDAHLADLLLPYRWRSYRMPRWVYRHRIKQVVKHLPGLSLSAEPHGLPPYLHRRRLRTPFTEEFRLFKGCDLFALTGRAAARLWAAPPALLRYYRHTRVPSESYVHTVLRNEPDLRNEAGMLHFARWSTSPHPELLTVDDLPEMLDSGKWFARKFAADDPVLDRLDDMLDAPAQT